MMSPLSQILGGNFLEGFRYPLLAMFLAMAVSWLLTPAVRSLAIQKGAVDDPSADDRRVHTEPIPRWGGLAIYCGIAISIAVILPFAEPTKPFPLYVIGLLVVGAFVVAIGALDDVKQYSAKVQALGLLAAGVAIQFFKDDTARVQMASLGIPFTHGQYVAFGIAAIPVTAFYIFVVSKTMDTIDGLDGLAAGIAAIAAITLALLAKGSQPRVAIIAACTAGAALGFLRHNYNPAKIFMGTGGAQLLGFLLACLSIVGAFKTAAAFALMVPVLAFGVPLFDAVNVVVRRLASGQPITQADKRHLHHQLLHRGLSQRQAVLVLYTAAALMGGILVFMVQRYAHS